MQKKFAQPVVSIEPKNPGLAGSSRKKSSFKKMVRHFDFSEGHNFLCLQNLGVVAYAKELSTNRSLY